jgi:periplasmic divalent cation tolerance protein
MADRIARGLLDRGLAACVKIDANVRSLYRWKGQLEDHSEIRLTIKFPARHGEAIEAFIMENHAYEVPEWIVLRPESVGQKYLDWVTGATALECVGGKREGGIQLNEPQM